MHIFITGAAGYIGGSIAERLLRDGHRLSGLVRNPAQAGALEARGIAPVPGSLDDAEVLADAARAADAVINCASSDHRGAIETLIAALAGTGKALIHTSGSSIVGDAAGGEPSEAVWDEEHLPEPRPDKAARVALDRRVLGAADDGIRAVVLCNTLIYGHGRGLARDSVQLPTLRDHALRTGVVRHVGRGLNVWSHVHVDDVAEVYALALAKAPAGLFAFVENGEASYRALTTAMARALSLGAPQGMSVEEAIALWGVGAAVYSLGSNSRVRGRRAREVLGWNPRGVGVIDWIGTEMMGSGLEH